MDGLRALDAHLDHLRLRGLSATHIKARRRAVERLDGWLDADRARPTILAATPDVLSDYVRRLPRTTARSLYVEMSHLGAFYAWCLEHERSRVDPMRKVPRPKLPKLLPRPMSEGDVHMAIEAATGRIRVWLVLAAYQGLRACEIAVLDRSDVLDTLPMPALVAHGKGRKDRVVPLGDRALLELRAYGLGRRGPLFPRPDGKPGPTSAHRVSVVANDYLHGLGISDTLHSLRHRFATMTYAGSQDLLVVAALLGHADPATTAGYAAYSNLAAQAAVRSLDEKV